MNFYIFTSELSDVRKAIIKYLPAINCRVVEQFEKITPARPITTHQLRFPPARAPQDDAPET